MNKLFIFVIAMWIAISVAIGTLIYVTFSAIDEHGLKSVTERIWEGSDEHGEEK